MSPNLPLPLPDPPLAGEGVTLRPWAPADAPVLSAAWADPDIALWTGVPDGDRTPERARRWIEGDAHRRLQGLALDLAVVADAEVPCGEIGISRVDPERQVAEIGWWTAKPWRGRGLASRAAAMVVAWAVTELCIERVYARVDPRNPASAVVARRAGLERRGLASDGLEVWATPARLASTVTP